MPSAKLLIINRLGLHARAAAKFMQTAAAYICEINVEKQAKSVNGKSIMGLMMLAAARGSELTVTTKGEDEDAALAALTELVNNRFGEPE
ncbi:MAG: HPr family phosphocarrier protein [Gammaproteobacteria bacterium]|nr:HPr family phosphocarrier protein [Gammaproteobacteria bacterium]